MRRVEMFPLYSEHSNSKALSGLIAQHLQILDERFNQYFPVETLPSFDWVHDPWNSYALESAADLPMQADQEQEQQEQLAEMTRSYTKHFGYVWKRNTRYCQVALCICVN